MIRKTTLLITCTLWVALSSSCQSGFKEASTNDEFVSFETYRSESPISVPSGVSYFNNVSYGDYERNKLDIWVDSNPNPSPLVIYIHGGGFRNGDKSAAYDKPSKAGIGPDQINRFLESGISFASINYRLLEGAEKIGVAKCLNDSKRAIQFLRYHAEELGLDPDKFALTGTSAGAGTALWIGLHDDMAELNSEDPLSRESTRVIAIAVQETQSTYDLKRWEGDVFPEELFTFEAIRNTNLGKRLMSFYGISSFDQIDQPDIAEYRKEVDMLGMVSSDDPPVYILNKQDFSPGDGSRVGNLLHSPYHAVALKKEFERAGVEHRVYIPADGSKPNEGQFVADFLLSKLR